MTKPLPPTGLCLSIRQPWAWLIVNGYKDIENREWATKVRGNILVHASGSRSVREVNECLYFVQRLNERHNVHGLKVRFEIPNERELSRGGIVGSVDLVGCVDDSLSPWFTGKYGFELRSPRVMPFFPCKGRLGFFKL